MRNADPPAGGRVWAVVQASVDEAVTLIVYDASGDPWALIAGLHLGRLDGAPRQCMAVDEWVRSPMQAGAGPYKVLPEFLTPYFV